METIYINKPAIKAKKETIYKRKLIIHDSNNILAYEFGNMYRTLSAQGEEDLIELTKRVTGLDIKEEDLESIVRVVSSYVRYDSQNYKLIPVVREIVRDFYSYYKELDQDTIDYLSHYSDEWYQKPTILSKHRILTSEDNTFKKLKIPVRYLWKKGEK